MAQTIFYVAAAIAVLLAGAGIFYAAWQVAATLKTLRQTLMPQVELTLTEVQRNLNQIDSLTQDVDQTVQGTTQLVSSANHAVQTVGQGIDSFNKRVAVPTMIRVRSAVEGMKASVKHMRAKRQREILVIEEPGSTTIVDVETRETVKP